MEGHSKEEIDLIREIKGLQVTIYSYSLIPTYFNDMRRSCEMLIRRIRKYNKYYVEPFKKKHKDEKNK